MNNVVMDLYLDSIVIDVRVFFVRQQMPRERVLCEKHAIVFVEGGARSTLRIVKA